MTWTTDLSNATYGVQWTPTLSSLAWTDSWGNLTGIIPTGTTYSAAVPRFYRIVAQQPRLYHFPDWYPDDPNVCGRQVFAVTNIDDSSSRIFTNRIIGFQNVPYKSGAIVGVRDSWSNTFYNAGRAVTALGGADPQYGVYFTSTDTSLSAPPPSASIADVTDGMIITDRAYYVTADLSLSQMYTNISLIQVQTVTVPAGVFSNAIIFWNLDISHSFVNLNFKGFETEMGITLPIGSQTHGYSVTDFQIYGYKTGKIVDGDVYSQSGNINSYLYRLKTVLPP